MEAAIIGLGRMGAGIAERLVSSGHSVVVHNRTPEKAAPLVALGARQGHTLAETVSMLSAPRVVWLYLPAGEATDTHVADLAGLLSEGDIVIDGGNSKFTESVRRAAELAEKGIKFIDVGTSGGTAGREVGYCLMAGGDADAFAYVEPLLKSVAQEGACKRVGPAGSGHYVKMVHNAIEYGMMQAYGEGFELLNDGSYAGKIDLPSVADLWQRGSIIRSYLGQLLSEAFNEERDLASIAASVDDSGEGQWTVHEALERRIPVPAIAAALFERYSSRRSEAFSYKVVSVLRKKFGGHAIKKTNA